MNGSQLARTPVGQRILDHLVGDRIDPQHLETISQTALYATVTWCAEWESSLRWSPCPDPPAAWLRIASTQEGDALADAVTKCAAAQWWSAPALDRTQLWIGARDASPGPGHPSPRHYGKPHNEIWTSSALDDGSSAWWHLLRQGADSPPPDVAQSVWRLTPRADARVYEINAPDDWARLCEAFPVVVADGYVGPDWDAVAAEYDGVHLSVEGLIRAQCVEVETAYGTAKLDTWDAESTAWLQWCFDAVARVGEVEPDP